MGFTENAALLSGANWTPSPWELDHDTVAQMWGDIQKGRPINAVLLGTEFQLKVWHALLALEPTQLISYRDIAVAIGHPKAVRAVGNAVGANPISYLVPCHQVVRSDGGLGGYRWGVGVKKSLLGRVG